MPNPRRLDPEVAAAKPRSLAALILLAGTGVFFFAVFVALGSWQVQRRSWKLALIARVDARVHAPAVPAPARARWPQVNTADDEYRHVQVAGRFLPDHDTFVQAVTDDGAGYWLLTPLSGADGGLVLVNRGFVPSEARESILRADQQMPARTTVTGLLRISEPGGAFLHRNDPAAGRWYSRDVPAIAAARGLNDVAPYFIDADAAPATSSSAQANPQWPAGGLTVVQFPNNHLIYVLTWYGLALLSLVQTGRMLCGELGARRDQATPH